MKYRIGLTLSQLIILYFVFIVLLSVFLLKLPFSVAGNEKISFTDALFTVISAITTTGLVVVDTGSFFTTFGQTVILVLIQIGGLGYMIFITLLIAGFRKKISFNRIDLLHSSGLSSNGDILKFSKKLVFFTLFFEFLGFILLYIYWGKIFPWKDAVFSSIFHSVSAFCTSGFSLYSDSFVGFRNSVFFNSSIIFICIAGSIGFLIFNDLYYYSKQIIHKKHPRRFSEHSKLALSVMVILIIVGIIIMFFSPGQPVEIKVKERLIYSTFQIVSASTTAGFNTINIKSLSMPILWVILLLMFIGSCPGGTGGGIKTTTFGIIVLSAGNILRGRESINIFHRSPLPETIMKAFSIVIISTIWLIFATGILLFTDSSLSIRSVLFELTSAFGTVGLSAGITSSLSFTGKIIVMLTMIMGRVGPLVIVFSLIGKPESKSYKLPKAEILVG